MKLLVDIHERNAVVASDRPAVVFEGRTQTYAEYWSRINRIADGLYRVELANGHKPLAHMTGKARREGIIFAPGDKVILVMSFYDLSVGRIKV